MSSLHPTFRFAVLFLLALAACAPGATPASSTPSLVPVDLAGPEMTIGSTWLYADGSLLVAVPAGIFTMGNGELKGRPENPEHPVNLSDFWIYRTKVTNAQYAYCVAMGGCTAPYGPDNPGFDDYLKANDPVVGVDYSQAADYCDFVHARLPTEAEWEKTARGTDARIHPWGETPPKCDLLNFDVCVGATTPVNSYPDGQSYYTAYDMEGNALEWVADWFQADYYLESPVDDPQGPASGRGRSVRSSAFNSGGDQIPGFTRSFSSPDTHRNNLGFRCVVEDPTYFAPFCTYPGVYGTDGIGGGPTGEQFHVTCPSYAIDQSRSCNGSTPVTIVTITGIQAWPYPYWGNFQGHCTGYPFTYTCTGDGQFKICSECSVIAQYPPQCPDEYIWDSDLHACLGSGAPGVCLPGTTPDATGQCCSFEAGTAAPTADPLVPGHQTPIYPGAGCPAGTWANYVGNQLQCIAVPVQSPFCVSANVSLLSCSQGGGGGCPPPAGGCGTNYAWDPNLCECVCDGC